VAPGSAGITVRCGPAPQRGQMQTMGTVLGLRPTAPRTIGGHARSASQGGKGLAALLGKAKEVTQV